MNKLLSCYFVILLWILPGCVPAVESGALLKSTAVLASPDVIMAVTDPAPTGSPVPTQPPSITAPPATIVITASSVPSATFAPAERPDHTPELMPSTAPAPSTTPWPTPANLPLAPRGWIWQLHAANIPVTHHIIQELSPDDADEIRERPYGLDDQPLAGVDPLPRTFLMKAAYQGSGRLPNGDILQYGATRAPVERELVPFRYTITPSERCGGHPIAGNGTCSVPLKTAATTMRDGEEPLVPVGSTIFIPELNMKFRINDVALSDGPPKIDLYTGTINNYDHERPNGAMIWLLTEE